jgi:hypothetical protein
MGSLRLMGLNSVEFSAVLNSLKNKENELVRIKSNSKIIPC